MKIFISGNPGVGKTTLIKRIYEKFPNLFIGFWTEEIREENRRVGFIIKTTWGSRYELASVKKRSPYRVGKYFVFPGNVDKVIKELESKIDNKRILLIDEIGKMEWYSEKFRSFVSKVLQEEIDIIATIHRNFLHLVPNYIWLEREKWWEIYKRIIKKIEIWQSTKLK